MQFATAAISRFSVFVSVGSLFLFFFFFFVFFFFFFFTFPSFSLNCADFDLCADCEMEMEHHHDPSHVFLLLSRPLPDNDLAVEFRRRFPFPPISDRPLTAMVHRGIFCAICKHPVTGARFVCCNCPEIFNICSTCQAAGPR